MRLKSDIIDFMRIVLVFCFTPLSNRAFCGSFCLYFQLAVYMAQAQTACFHATVLATVTLQEAAMQETLVRALNITKILTPTMEKHSQGRNAR